MSNAFKIFLVAIFLQKPSIKADFPTPGSPVMITCGFNFLFKISVIVFNSSSLPIMACSSFLEIDFKRSMQYFDTAFELEFEFVAFENCTSGVLMLVPD